MPIDYSKIPTEDLEALTKKDYGKVSTNTLQLLQGGTKEISTGEKFVSGMKKGITDIGYGLTQRLLQGAEELGVVGPEKLKKYEDYVQGELKQYHEKVGDSTAATAGEMVGTGALMAPLPGGIAGGFVKRAATGAATGAAIAGAQYTPEDGSTAANVVIGAGTGAATSLGLSGVGKVISAIKNPVANAIQELSKKYGVRATLGEITNNPLVQKMETWLESVPIIGLKVFREKQHKEAEDLAQRTLSYYIHDPTAPNAMEANRQYAASLFQGLTQSVAGIHDQAIAPAETKQSAGKLLLRFPDIFKKFQDTRLEGLIGNVAEGTKDVVKNTGILNAQGNPIVHVNPQTLTFQEAWELRSGLGELIGQARKKIVSGEVNQTEVGALKALFSSVNKDIEQWTDQIGRQDIKASIKEANEAYKRYVVKYDMVERAYAKASGEVGGGEIFSPKRFSTALKAIVYKQKKGGYTTFSDTEIDHLTGVANIMQVVKRAGQYMENPPTGNRWGLPVVAGEVLGYLVHGTAGGVAAAGGITTGAGVARFLTGTEVGKRFALAASKVEANSPAMSKIVNQLYNQMTKVGSLAGQKMLEGEPSVDSILSGMGAE